MIKRIFKTIFILTVSLGISIPTNAAVSVSDGSAFVTKAEFSADLNNLSNRMAQLENSLDAKIDSLVSSYLTRNGIWNGAKQDLEGYTITYTASNNPFANDITGINTIITNLIDQQFTSNKAGMLVIQFNSRLNRPNPVGSWRPTIRCNDVDGLNVIQYRSTRRVCFQVYDYNNNILIDQAFINMDVTNPNEAVLAFPDSLTYNIYCFVEKNTVGFKVYEYWFSAVGGYKVSTNKDIFYQGGTLTFSVLSANVY